jgi:hypothetical protein
MAGGGTVFVVMRYNWRRAGARWHLMPGSTRLASYPSRAEAEAEAARRERNARQRVNPFTCGADLVALTSMPEPIFLDWIQDAGFTPPTPDAWDLRDWPAWWDALPADPEPRARVWEAFDKLRFFLVVERPNVPVGYAVLSRCWQYNDEYYYLNHEGGQVQAVYRTRERALAAARELHDNNLGNASYWQPAGADLFDPETYWEMFVSGGADIVEIELEGLA